MSSPSSPLTSLSPLPSHQYEDSREAEKKSAAVREIPASGTGEREVPLIHRNTRRPSWISTGGIKKDPSLETSAEHISSGSRLPAESTYVTRFRNVRHYEEKYEEAWQENLRKNKNDNGEFSEETGEVIPKIHLGPPLYEGDPDSPLVIRIEPDKPFSAVAFVYGENPGPWIDTTDPDEVLMTEGVSSCVSTTLMAKRPDSDVSHGEESIQIKSHPGHMRSMAHFYMENEQTDENIMAKDNDMRQRGYTGDKTAKLIGAWVREEDYARDSGDTEGEGVEITPEYLEAIGRHADRIANLVSKLGYTVDDRTRENRYPYEHSNRRSNIASYTKVDKNGQLQLLVSPDARVLRDAAKPEEEA